MKIPFKRLYTTGREISYMQQCIDAEAIEGGGRFTRQVQEWLKDRTGSTAVFLTSSGTAALEMAALLLGLQPGDEVIMPSFTFSSTANAVMLRGALPVFVDISPGTLNLDPSQVEEKVTKRTKAIIPVHYAGAACDMDALMEIAGAYDLFIIEDAAQAIGGTYNNKHLGTIGDLGCFSFHATKNITCGEGGALLINRFDPELLKQAEWVWEKGTNRGAFGRGEVKLYTWTSLGSSYLPSELLAAFLLAQLEEMDFICEARKRIYRYYYDHLLPYQQQGIIQLPVIPAGAGSSYHLFFFRLGEEKQRNDILTGLAQRGVQAVFHYIPLHTSPMGRKLGYKEGDLPVTELVSRTLVRLPLYPHLNKEQQDWVIKALWEVLGPVP